MNYPDTAEMPDVIENVAEASDSEVGQAEDTAAKEEDEDAEDAEEAEDGGEDEEDDEDDAEEDGAEGGETAEAAGDEDIGEDEKAAGPAA